MIGSRLLTANVMIIAFPKLCDWQEKNLEEPRVDLRVEKLLSTSTENTFLVLKFFEI